MGSRRGREFPQALIPRRWSRGSLMMARRVGMVVLAFCVLTAAVGYGAFGVAAGLGLMQFHDLKPA